MMRNIQGIFQRHGMSRSTQKLSACYHERVVKYFENPPNVGSLKKNKQNVGTGESGSMACGDQLRFQIEVGDDGIVTNAVFKAFGCGSAIASSSYATELVKGKHVDELAGIKNSDISAFLSLPPVKLHCSVLAEDAIQKALQDFKKKNGQEETSGEEVEVKAKASEKS